MAEGFLPFSRATLMLDVVTVAMVLIVPLLTASIYLARVRRNYVSHKNVQIALSILLLITIVLFEIDVRLSGWTQYAKASPHYDTFVYPVLYIHLFFAVSTTLIWVYTLTGALRRIPEPPSPCEYSRRHRFWGRLSTWTMYLTAITGWSFYYLAFVAD